MFSHSADLYDLIYSSFKDYSQEAGRIAALLRQVHPPCHTILDVACGTGEHAHLLAAHYGFAVDGLDLDPAFVRLAQSKHPEVRRTLACFREHLATDGVVIVEPWFTPGRMEDGRSDMRAVEAPGLRVVRVSHTELQGRLSRIRFDYEIHASDGVRHATEVHELGLFTTDEMLRSFEASGLAAEYESEGLTGRGLFIARAAA